MLVAIPLESFLMVVTLAGWSAVYLGKEAAQSARPMAKRRRQTDPWIVRGLMALLLLAIVGNGIPSAVDAAWARDQDLRLTRIARAEIAPEEALAPQAPSPAAAPEGLTRYRVNARLHGDHLTWTTHLLYSNDTGETLEDIGLHLYPAAYTRAVEAIPLAETLAEGDLNGAFRAQARPGTFQVTDVQVAGTRKRSTLEDTALTVALPRPLRPRRRVGLAIRLEARLPRWPERFGVWDDRILLGNWIPTVAVREHGAWRLDEFSGIGDPFYSEVADYRVNLELDDALGVVGTGDLTGIAATDGRRRRVWTFTSRATRDAAFAVSASFQGLEQRAGGTLVRSWYRADERERGASNLETAVEAMRDFGRRFGELPYDEVDIVETGGYLGGMEYPGVVFTSDSSSVLAGVPLLGDLFRHAGFDAAQERYVVGHEVAHQWWYAAVGNDQIEEPWLDEAFAEMSTRLWLRRADGDDRVFRTVNGAAGVPARPGVISAGVEDFGSNSAYSEAVYLAGANLLIELRERLGAAAWDKVMRTWYRRTTLEIGTVEEFIDTVSDVAGAPAARRLRHFL
ncbi:MAG: M1 family metallopeptidase [Actinobacteria bacterium]|nr:M1 family metallopeptidase [Actinomycetota bacterium]